MSHNLFLALTFALILSGQFSSGDDKLEDAEEKPLKSLIEIKRELEAMNREDLRREKNDKGVTRIEDKLEILYKNMEVGDKDARCFKYFIIIAQGHKPMTRQTIMDIAQLRNPTFHWKIHKADRLKLESVAKKMKRAYGHSKNGPKMSEEIEHCASKFYHKHRIHAIGHSGRGNEELDEFVKTRIKLNV